MKIFHGRERFRGEILHHKFMKLTGLFIFRSFYGDSFAAVIPELD